MAPELVSRKPYDSKVDIWALGVLAHIILVGVEPFKGQNKEIIFKKALNDTPNFLLFMKFNQGGKLVTDFLKRCLNKRPQERATAQELLNHPWIKANVTENSVNKAQ